MNSMRSLLRIAPLAFLALPFAACSSNKDYEKRQHAAEIDPTVQKSFSSLVLEAEKTLAPQAAYEQVARTYPIGTGKPDPGSTHILVNGKTTNDQGKPYTDVASAEAGYQFAWLWDVGETYAKATFTYDDNTPEFVIPYRTPSTTGYGWGGWEPSADPWPAEMGPGPANAWRFRGGTFTEYGGGVGISLRTVSNNKTLRSTAGITLLEQTPSKDYPDENAGAYDVSSYEGMAIWVRRGPDGQASMRIGLTERHSAEDLNSGTVRGQPPAAPLGVIPVGVSEGKYCKRWRICGCSAGTECLVVPNEPDQHHPDQPSYRCYNPAVHTPNELDRADLDYIIKYPHCGASRCADTSSSTLGPDPDPLFDGKECREYVTPDGHSDSYCYNPGDPTPPSKRERCGNPFSRAFTVSTDWQLIKVPFNELRQADEADVAADMDLTSVKQVAFSYTAGNIDYWVANIGFYRKQP